MTKHAVVIAGGGPTGLMLAGELALARVDVAIVERRENPDLAGSRAGGLHARTIEVLDQRGIADRFVTQGKAMQVAAFATIPLDISDFPTRHNYGLALWQSHIERILAAWVAELAVPIYRAREVTGFAQDDSGVDVELSPAGDLAASSEGGSLRAQYLVGCDGGRSLVRKKAGIDFPGWAPSISYLIAEAEMAEEPAWGIRHGERGVDAIGKLEDGKRVRVVLNEKEVRRGDEPENPDNPSLSDLREALIAVYGTDYGVHDVTWLSRFSDATRQAASYRARRVLLAGDAAHIHSPVGGQGPQHRRPGRRQSGMETGSRWSRARRRRACSIPTPPSGTRSARACSATTMAQTALEPRRRTDERPCARRCRTLLQMVEPRKAGYAAMMSGLDIRYELGAGHALLGRRMPDLDLVTASGPRRLFTLLHAARPVLLNLGEPGALDIASVRCLGGSGGADRRGIRRRSGMPPGKLGAVAAPSAVLVRPDGHVAWAGDGTERGLRDALTAWFGAPAD